MKTRVFIENSFVVDSMTLVRHSKEGFVTMNTNDVKGGGEVIIWVRLKAISSKSIELLRTTDFRPIQLKWLRNSNYGYVPERNYYVKESIVNQRDIGYYENLFKSQGYFFIEIISSNLLKQSGLYVIRPVYNDNQPAMQNGKEAEFKFEIRY